MTPIFYGIVQYHTILYNQEAGTMMCFCGGLTIHKKSIYAKVHQNIGNVKNVSNLNPGI